MLGRLVSTGETFMILSANSTAITDSQVNAEPTSPLNPITIKYMLPQGVLTATLTASSKNQTTTLKGVEDVSSSLKLRKAYIDGLTARDEMEANIGRLNHVCLLGPGLSSVLASLVLLTAVFVMVAIIRRRQTKTEGEGLPLESVKSMPSRPLPFNPMVYFQTPKPRGMAFMRPIASAAAFAFARLARGDRN